MGQKLVAYYALVKERAGTEGAMRLAMKTCIGSTVAAGQPDSPRNIEKFKKAIKEIVGIDVDP